MRLPPVLCRSSNKANNRPVHWASVSAGRFCWLLALLVTTCFLSVNGQGLNRQMVNQILSQLPGTKADTSRIRLLIDVGKFHLHKPGGVEADLDSSRTYLLAAKRLSDSLRVPTWQREAETLLVINCLEGGDSPLAHRLFTQLINRCRQTHDKASEANARFAFGYCMNFTTKDFPEIFANYKQAIILYRQLHDDEKEIGVLKEMASIHTNQGQLALADSEFHEVLSRYKAIHYPKLHYTYNWLATISRLRGDFNKSLYYSLQCIESMKRTQDTVSAASFYGNLAQMYLELGRQPQAVAWYKKTLTRWRQDKLPNFGMYSAANVVVSELIRQHKAPEALKLINGLVTEIPTINFIQKGSVAQSLAYCYDALNDESLAEKYYVEAMQYYKEANHDFEMSRRAQLEVGKFYLKHNQFKKADFYVRPLLIDSTQKNSLASLKDIHYILFKIDSSERNYLSAIQHFTRHKALNDSIFNVTKSRQFAQVEVQYETQKNKQNIALLRKQSKLQRSELKQAQTTRNGIVAGIVLLTGLLAVSYNRYRIKQRSNRLLEAKQLEINQKNQSLAQSNRLLEAKQLEINQTNQALQRLLQAQNQLLAEKEWMLREIHHRVKNNLQVITSLLHSQGLYLKDEVASAAIRESQNRVHTMALIHQKLYQSDRLAAIPMGEYVTEIIDYLLDSFDRADTVSKQTDVVAVELDVTLAVPLGLIINEAVTNSLKYAFLNQQRGTLSVQVVRLDNATYRLTISDDGVGLPTHFNPRTSRTMGMNLIRGLSKQLGADLTINSDAGVQIRLDFTEEAVSRDYVKEI